MDLLLTQGPVAAVVELKIDHRENPFQYAGYRRHLMRSGVTPYVIGIVRSNPSRGREALNLALCTHLTDRRITWCDLISRLESIMPGVLVAQLRAVLARIDENLLIGGSSAVITKLSVPEITRVESDPVHLAAFFARFVEELPEEFEAYPDQAGSSPPLLRFGRADWGTWFGDGNAERVFLMVDHPRKSKPMTETEFSFGITVWDKSGSARATPPIPRRLTEVASRLASAGFTFQRNRPGKYNPIAWLSPYDVGRTGFFYANALGYPTFKLTMSEAARVGTSKAVAQLATEARRITKLLDRIAGTG